MGKEKEPVHVITARTLRHWTLNNQEFVEQSQRPAPTLLFSERRDGGQFSLLTSKLARVKSDLANRVS